MTKSDPLRKEASEKTMAENRLHKQKKMAGVESNHDRRDEIWLVVPKKSAGGDSYRVYHSAALDEALCFGRIDGRIRRLDVRGV